MISPFYVLYIGLSWRTFASPFVYQALHCTVHEHILILSPCTVPFLCNQVEHITTFRCQGESDTTRSQDDATKTQEVPERVPGVQEATYQGKPREQASESHSSNTQVYSVMRLVHIV